MKYRKMYVGNKCLHFFKLWCAMSRGKEMPIAQMKWHLDAQTTFEVEELEANQQGLTNYECPCN
jgi:hypothetical protein